MAIVCFSVIKLCYLWKASWHAKAGIDPKEYTEPRLLYAVHTVRNMCCYLFSTNREANANGVMGDPVCESSAFYVTALL